MKIPALHSRKSKTNWQGYSNGTLNVSKANHRHVSMEVEMKRNARNPVRALLIQLNKNRPHDSLTPRIGAFLGAAILSLGAKHFDLL
jgi:hypothetical protein